MARLQLSKSSLAREKRSLRTFERFLPSLDLKRQQLMAERTKAREAMAATEAEVAALTEAVGAKLPMLANEDVDPAGLVVLKSADIVDENVVGTHLPRLAGIEVDAKDYALLARPHWVDTTVEMVRQSLELRIRLQVEARRVELLDAAVRTITQRVNLFEKVLIPKARENIKRIRIYLSDGEMAAVVRSKIAKRQNAERGA